MRYEGLTAHLVLTGMDPGEFWGTIFPGEMPPFPEASTTTALAAVEPEIAQESTTASATATATGSAEDATALLDQWVADWNAADQEAVAALFGSDASLTMSGRQERVGEVAGAYMAGFIPTFTTMRRTGVGSYSLTVERESEHQTDKRVLTMSTDGESLLAMDEAVGPVEE